MSLDSKELRINIEGDLTHVVNYFLRVFLTQQRLTEKQLDVTTELVSKYTEYIFNGVKEPYASQLLFSTESRKDICTTLKISAAHLNNTFTALAPKNILAKEAGKYTINPSIVPTSRLVFNFKVTDDKQRSSDSRGSEKVEPTEESGGPSNEEPVLSIEEDDSGEGDREDFVVPKSGTIFTPEGEEIL